MTVFAPPLPHSPRSEREPGIAGSALLPIDKPAGPTSHDVVDRVRRRLGIRSAGHLGTLDPGASGLLLVATGAATRCASVWQGGDKTYLATLRLGVVTRTQDLAGEVLEERPVAVDEAAVRRAALEFTGEIEQIPPMVSALKVGGQRLHRLARRGIEVERAPRPIRIAEWEWLEFALPEATFRVRCSSGTYVRTLVHDLGQRLGTGAALRALRRLRSEPFGLEHAIAFADLDRGDRERVWASAIPLGAALEVLPAVEIGPADLDALGHGIAVAVAPAAVVPPRPERARAAGGEPDPEGLAERTPLPAGELPLEQGPRSVVLRAPDGAPLGLGELCGSGATTLRAHPHVIFPWASRQGRR